MPRRGGHALIDRELYLPAVLDRRPGPAAGQRASRAGTRFATKPGLARRMIARALDAGTPAAWVTGDEVYGADPGLRADLERRRVGYVLAVACSHRVATGAGASRADALAAMLPRSAWQRYSAGPGAKGHRCYDWAWIGIEPAPPRVPLAADPPQHHAPASWRSTAATRPAPSRWPPWSRSPGRRWAVEEDFQAAKGLAGLDEHQVRRWNSWYRWTTLAMLAAAFLTITAAAEHARSPAPGGQIPLTRNEIGRLLATLIIRPAPGTWHRLRWSAWRRRHQHRARTSHYQRQARQP